MLIRPLERRDFKGWKQQGPVFPFFRQKERLKHAIFRSILLDERIRLLHRNVAVVKHPTVIFSFVDRFTDTCTMIKNFHR